jgi:hypothetical protein
MTSRSDSQTTPKKASRLLKHSISGEDCILVKMPGTDYVLEIEEARELRNALNFALEPVFPKEATQA